MTEIPTPHGAAAVLRPAAVRPAPARRRATGLRQACALLAGLVFVLGGASQETSAAGERGAPLFADLGDHHHPISTTVPEAQRYFDQGLVLVYAFNHAEAERSFRQAARLDPDCAICWWGVALVLGPNINLPMDEAAVAPAWEALEGAVTLAAHASPRERDFIQALEARYVPEPGADRASLDRAYATAMRGVVAAHPDDLDARTLLADALMDTMPWDYWIAPDLAKPETEEVLTLLEEVMAADPYHPGALHLYIHAVEASSDPGRGEAAADRLANLVPGAGHLVHMPAHIYIRIGRYDDAVKANQRAAGADEAYIAQCRAQGFYPALYYPHNVHFLWAEAQLDGRRDLAVASVEKLVVKVPAEMLPEFPMLEEFLPVPYYAYLRFGLWDTMLAAPRPPEGQGFTTAMWHYGRGMALTAGGRHDEARQALLEVEGAAASDAMQGLGLASGSNAAVLLRIAAHGLRGQLAEARGDHETAIAEYRQAILLEDGLPYSEPEPWYLPMRQVLGATLLQAGDATGAERVYREDLAAHPRNGWSLFGLAASLAAQGRTGEQRAVEGELAEAWARAEVRLSASRF